jgi:hypothetical protein
VPELAGEIGRWMLVASAVIAALGVAAVVPRALSVRRRGRLLQVHAVQARLGATAALDELAARQATMERLLRPWRTLLKWATHPLTMALLQSYRRRWAMWRNP